MDVLKHQSFLRVDCCRAIIRQTQIWCPGRRNLLREHPTRYIVQLKLSRSIWFTQKPHADTSELIHCERPLFAVAFTTRRDYILPENGQLLEHNLRLIQSLVPRITHQDRIPPIDRGITWSSDKSRVWNRWLQYWHVYWSLRKTFFFVKAGLCKFESRQDEVQIRIMNASIRIIAYSHCSVVLRIHSKQWH